MIFRHPKTGIVYETFYSCGLTEVQDESPFENADEMIGCQPMVEIEVTEKRWVQAC